MTNNKLFDLASKIELKIKLANFKAEIDALESYPGEQLPTGELISAFEKLKAAQKAVVEDLNTISQNYYMYDNQLKEAEQGLYLQKFLFHYAKKIQGMADIYLANKNINIEALNDEIQTLSEEAANAWPSNAQRAGKKVQPLAELQSLRVLRALVQDAIRQSKPAYNSVSNINEMHRQNEQKAKEQYTPKPIQNPSFRMPISETMKSRLKNDESTFVLDSSNRVEED